MGPQAGDMGPQGGDMGLQGIAMGPGEVTTALKVVTWGFRCHFWPREVISGIQGGHYLHPGKSLGGHREVTRGK